MSETNILPCSCRHEFQDGKYGKGKRVHNFTIKPGLGARCTVCGKVKPRSGGESVDPKAKKGK